ncbi:hypothetical protein C9439_04655 [archaeon SCG-AAA382B04]|nr:hypothetical protein C9439_04655 [archaeon SCG-AAA382B04]
MKAKIKKLIRNKENPVFLGLGNEIRGDDGVGIFITKKIKKDYKTIIGEKNPEKHLKKIKKEEPDLLFIIDSMDNNSPPGSVIFSEAKNIKKRSMSSHRMPIPVLVEILKDKLPNLEVYLIGIQPKKIDIKEELSDEVKETAETIIGLLRDLSR